MLSFVGICLHSVVPGCSVDAFMQENCRAILLALGKTCIVGSGSRTSLRVRLELALREVGFDQARWGVETADRNVLSIDDVTAAVHRQIQIQTMQEI